MSFLVSFFVDWGAGDVFFPNEDSDSDMDADRDTDTQTQTQTLILTQTQKYKHRPWNCPKRRDQRLKSL